MIDSIHIVLDRHRLHIVDVSKVQQLLTDTRSTHYSQFERSYFSGNYKNFRVAISADKILINGSLPKLLYGHNVVTLTHVEVIKALKHLAEVFDLPIFKGHISRIDLAENLTIKKQPQFYYAWLLDTPKYTRSKTKSVHYTRGTFELDFYDKSYEAFVHNPAISDYGVHHVLRVELRIKSKVKRALGWQHGLYVAHLFSRSFFILLARCWAQHYFAIVKQHQLCKPPVIQRWKGFQDYLLTKMIIESGYTQVDDILNWIATENKWNTRTTREVRKMLRRLHDGALSQPNKYIAELDTVVKQTYTYSLTLND